MTSLRELRKAYENKAYAFNQFVQHDKDYFEKDRDNVLDTLSEEYYLATRTFENGVDDVLRKTSFTTRDIIDYTRMWKKQYQF